MSIREIGRTSTLYPEQDGVVVHEDIEVEEEAGIRGDEDHGESQAAHEVDSDEEENDIELDKEEDHTSATALPTFANEANAKTVFGMKRSNPTVKKGNATYDYEQKYPEDAPYEEAAPAARVWKTYEDESTKHHVDMVQESRDNVNVLLVFAGLFSAVVTTFVAQTSQSLQPDYAAMSASLFYESVLVQRAIANGIPVNSIAPSSLNPTMAFVPATTDVWVNALWFTSLFLSLTTALVAFLVNQWLHHYLALPSGPPRDRSFTRQFRYVGFEKWHVQVIIELLPILMHLALAIFLAGLVVFLHPLRAALSWIICAGTGLVYTAYGVATTLPVVFPQCPYRTPLCDVVYVSLRRTVPRVTWYNKEDFLSSLRERDLNAMFRCLPRVQARTRQSLTMIESKFVKQMSTNLAAEALHWLFSVSSNPSVQSIVLQSIGGLPMASEEKFLELMGDSKGIMAVLKESLLEHCLLEMKHPHYSFYEPVPGMEQKIGRLLRFDPSGNETKYNAFIDIPGVYSFELTAAILSIDCTLHDRESLNESVSPGVFLMDISHSSKLSPRSWYHLMRTGSQDLFSLLDPDLDDNANIFPLLLCSAILKSFPKSRKGLTQEFDSPLACSFEDALPYFIDKIYDAIPFTFSKSVEDTTSSLRYLRILVVATNFLLHRLSLPDYEMSHTTILESLIVMNECISEATFSSQEAITVIPALEDIIACCVVPDDSSRNWNKLWYYTIIAYHSLTTVAPSACSSRGLRSTIDYMTSHWDWWDPWHQPKYECGALTDLLVKRTPVAFTVFWKNHCLEFLGTHVFHEASVPMVRAYVAGILAMQRGSDVDAATLQLHIDYLHAPHNFFTVCSILASHSCLRIGRNAIHKDITTLVQLFPTRDTAWDECCGKLRDLVQSDDRDFFGKQSVVCTWGSRELTDDEMKIEKDNIKYAIQVLDDFFNGRAQTVDLVPSTNLLQVKLLTGHIDRFVGWCYHRKPDAGIPKQKQEV